MMKYSEKALQLDLSGMYSEAIENYELAIRTEPSNVNFYIDLSFLYWHTAADFSWSDYFNISSDIKKRSADRYIELLEIAKTMFIDNCELYFWEKYFWHRVVFDTLSEEDVLSILSKCKIPMLTPFFFLYLLDPIKYRTERDKILEGCKILPTAKNLYIKSLIEND